MNREEVLNVILSYAEITPNSLAVVDNSDELTYSELRILLDYSLISFLLRLT